MQKPTYAFSGSKGLTDKTNPIVFIHGTGMDHTVWTLPARHFVRHKRNVLAIDLPAHGRSSSPACTSIEDMAKWVTCYLDELGVNEFSVVGHSMGSLIALETAALAGTRVKSLVMVGTAVPMAVSDFLLEAARNNDQKAINILTYMGYSYPGRIGRNGNPGIWMTGITKKLLEQAANNIIYTDLKACAEYDQGLNSADKVTADTMLILGENDYLTPVRKTKKLIGAFKNPVVKKVQDSGHSLMIEQPNVVLDYLRETLNKFKNQVQVQAQI